MANPRKSKEKPPPVFAPERLEVFLEQVSRTGLKSTSARTAGIRIDAIQIAMMHDKELKRRFDLAMEYYNESVEQEIHRRAIEGIDKPIFWQGALCATVREYSDPLLVVLAKKRMPEYRERSIEAQVTNGGVLVVNAPPESAEDWEKRFRKKEDAKDGEPTGPGAAEPAG